MHSHSIERTVCPILSQKICHERQMPSVYVDPVMSEHSLDLAHYCSSTSLHSEETEGSVKVCARYLVQCNHIRELPQDLEVHTFRLYQ